MAPQELNTPLVFGGLVAWWVSSRTKDEKLNAARASRGTLIASGFIAAGSLLGVFNAIMRFVGLEPPAGHWAESQGGEIFGLVVPPPLRVHDLVLDEGEGGGLIPGRT